MQGSIKFQVEAWQAAGRWRLFTDEAPEWLLRELSNRVFMSGSTGGGRELDGTRTCSLLITEEARG
jgi:hypothetical protein